ncbi:DUF6907 domain-containing protein [Streptomyces lydicus]|uniref:DUF6907 domain-containing protein n=1 Tax=Streptomyces lydicus TaxID=47763 RepID=UPI0036E44892
MTVLAPAVPAQVAPSRQVAVSVAGVTVVVPCPIWCTDPHAGNYVDLVDLSHNGDAIFLAAPSYRGAVERTLIARVSSRPFSGTPETERPFLVFDPIDDECAQLDSTAALALADQVIAHGHALRAMAASIAG